MDTTRTNNVISGIIIPALLAVSLIIACLWGVQRKAEADSYKNAAESIYRQTYYELANNFSDLETALSKLMVANSRAQYIMQLDDIWRISGACSGLISRMPTSHQQSQDIAQFTIRISNYARTLTKNVISGNQISEDDRKQLENLLNACHDITNEVNDAISNDDIPTALIGTDDYYSQNDEEQNKTASDEADEKYPTLIYDGPFSESTESEKPVCLGEREVYEEEAIKTAKYVLGNFDIKSSEVSEGTVPAYNFSGDDVQIEITKNGGHVLWFMSHTSSDKEGMPEADEVEKYKKAATDFMNKCGYKSMTATYGQYYGGAALISFVYEQDGVLVYNDLIKVWVDRDTYKVVGLDARNYLFKHTYRNISKPSVSKNEAKMMVSAYLDIKSENLALIPLTPSKECLCYEFKGEYAGSEYIVYINAENGEEQEIFKIIDTGDGQLTM